MIARLRSRLADALDRRFEALHHRVGELAVTIEEKDAVLREELAELRARLDVEIAPALRIMAGSDAESRRLLEEARSDPEYGLAWEEPDPLVTVVLPTHGRTELVRSRSLPSVLAQTHEHLEVLVIADAPDAESENAAREIGDARVRVLSLAQRYVYPDASRHWQAASTLTRNEGYRLARGRWLFDADDDDSLPPDAVEVLLQAARERRAEAVQGLIRHVEPNGGTRDVRPELPGRLPLKGALVHAHLRFFGREHVASAFGIPGDWFRGERMLRAGVRIELLDRVTYEYYPSTLWLRA